jgi:hypothetical protein
VVKAAHPLMLRAIAAARKKNDRIDAGKIADCLRCNFCRSARWHRPRFGTDGERCATAACLVRRMMQTKNRVSGLLMETGLSSIVKIGFVIGC